MIVRDVTSQPEQIATNGHHRMNRIVVIGGGFGGLATAIRLQAAGHTVTLVEAREKLGGRAYQLSDRGFTFDMGPSLITAPDLLERLWSAAGRKLEDDLSLVPLNPFYRIYFQDGRYFDYGGGVESDEAQIAKFDSHDIEGLRQFLAATEHIYKRAFQDLAGQPFNRLRMFMGIVPELVRLGAHRSVYHFVSRFIRDPYLRMVFSFHPLFIGGNPFRASAIYSIVPYLERQEGVHFAKGGMYSVIQAMEQLFRDLGGEVRCGAPVEQILINNGQAAGVRIAGGEEIPADAVVANSDVATTYLRLLPEKYRHRFTSFRLQRYQYSMSCFLLYLGLNKQYDQLLHHTIIMPDRYKRLISEIFDGSGLPSDLAMYLHAPTKTDPSMAPQGGESLYILVPVPHLGRGGVDWETEAQPFRDRVIRFLEREFGMDGLEASIEVEHRFTPLDFESELGSWLGAAFSIEPTLYQSAYLRPHNRSGQIPGLYFVGAGTHPGAGLPGVLLSSEITSQLVCEDFAPSSERIWLSKDHPYGTQRDQVIGEHSVTDYIPRED